LVPHVKDVPLLDVYQPKIPFFKDIDIFRKELVAIFMLKITLIDVSILTSFILL
jgi:hypothetical protein